MFVFSVFMLSRKKSKFVQTQTEEVQTEKHIYIRTIQNTKTYSKETGKKYLTTFNKR